MADTKISNLPVAQDVDDDDVMVVNEDDVTCKSSISYLRSVFVGAEETARVAAEQALSDRIDGKADTSDIPTALSDLTDDSTHRLVTDAEKTTWNGKSDFSGSYNDLTDKPTIPTIEANPSGEATDELDKIRIGSTIYDVVGGGGGSEPVYGEASGAIAFFADGSANPLKSLVVDINPVQAGSGTPAPDNVRPISGWSSVEVTVAGKNLYSDVFADYTMPSDYRICPIPLEIGKTYTASAKLVGTAVSGCVIGLAKKGDRYSDFGSFITLVNSSGNVYTNTITLDNTWTSPKLIVYAANETAFNSLFENYEVQLEVGSTATSYEAYNADTETISLGQTVYGGKLNVTTGELTVTHGFLYVDGSFNVTNVAYNTTEQLYYVIVKNSLGASEDNELPISDKFNSYAVVQIGNTYITYNGNYLVAVLPDQTADTVAKATQWFADNPTQFVYKLATPTTVTLTPTQVSSILGTNNIWADSGDSDVVYIRNLNLFLNQLDARVKALENA